VERRFDILMDIICIAIVIIMSVFLIVWFSAAVKVCPTDDFFTEFGNLFNTHF